MRKIKWRFSDDIWGWVATYKEDTKLDWDFATEPEPHVDGRSLFIPRGKALGGSSSMNAMLYVAAARSTTTRGRRRALPAGAMDVLPYFMRSEDNVRGASEYHGAGGPLRVSEQRSPRPLDRRLLAASEAAGIPRIADYNGPEQDGASMFQVTQQDGRALQRRRRLPAPGAEAAQPRGPHAA